MRPGVFLKASSCWTAPVCWSVNEPVEVSMSPLKCQWDVDVSMRIRCFLKTSGCWAAPVCWTVNESVEVSISLLKGQCDVEVSMSQLKCQWVSWSVNGSVEVSMSHLKCQWVCWSVNGMLKCQWEPGVFLRTSGCWAAPVCRNESFEESMSRFKRQWDVEVSMICWSVNESQFFFL